jgi:hypothetical protein
MAGNPTLPVHQTREGSGTHGKNSGKGRATLRLIGFVGLGRTLFDDADEGERLR